MRRRHKGAIALFLALGLVSVGLTACGNELSRDAEEGEPIGLGDLEFNVQETRYLNPDQPDDQEYLEGQRVPAPGGQTYLGVFLTVKNHADHPVQMPAPGQVSITDTTGADYQALVSNTNFAAPLGEPIPAGGTVPAPDTAAANGPTQGAIILFLLPQAADENRPLKLELQVGDETGEITLDI